MSTGFANVTKQISLIGGNAIEDAPKIVRYDGGASGELPIDMVNYKRIKSFFIYHVL